MEDLQAKYGFSDEQMVDIREVIVNSIKEIIPAVISESANTLAEKCKETVSHATKHCFPTEITPPSQEAMQFIAINKQSWKLQLAERNKLYGQFIRCESLLDTYGLCLQEEPPYVPRRYRQDKIHVLYDEEKSIRTTANLQNMQTDMEVLKIRRDNYKRLLAKCDENSLKFIAEKTNDSAPLTQEILSIWNESFRQDQEKVDKTWARKVASMHVAFEKDKQSLSRIQEEKQQVDVEEIYSSEIDTDDDYEDGEFEEADFQQKNVHFANDMATSSKSSLKKPKRHAKAAVANRKVDPVNTIRRTIRNDAFVPSNTKQAQNASTSKNEQRSENLKDRGRKNKQYPLRSSTYLDSISRPINSNS